MQIALNSVGQPYFDPPEACQARPAARVFRRGQERRFCMIRGESHSDQKMAGEADLDTVELLYASRRGAGGRQAGR